MAKKPHSRSLCAEPLEERLPVSSSAAGVLLGFGLNQQNETPYVAEYRTDKSSSQIDDTTISFDALDDFTLNSLDAMAVDRIHAEDDSMASSTSSSSDPFELTPLTFESSLDDAASDPVRELGDELLLFQISAIDFAQPQLNFMTPHMSQVESGGAVADQTQSMDFATDSDYPTEWRLAEEGVTQTTVATDDISGSDVFDGSVAQTAAAATYHLESISWGTYLDGARIVQDPSVPGGSKIFPEKRTSTDTSPNFNKFKLTVLVSNPSQTEDMTFALAAVDLTNWLDNEYMQSPYMPAAWSNDNNGTIDIPASITVPAGRMAATVDVTITDAHAGDNWIFTAKQAGDIKFKWTPQLTVWRTLNVEWDKIIGANNTLGAINLTDIAKAQLERACISLTTHPCYPTALNATNPGGFASPNMLTGTDIDNISKNFFGRNIKANSPQYLVTRVVMAAAYEGLNDFAHFVFGNAANTGTILVYETLINIGTNYWGTAYPNSQVTTAQYIPRAILHEICHVLIDDAERHIIYHQNKFWEYRMVNEPDGGQSIEFLREIPADQLSVRDSIVCLDPSSSQVKRIPHMTYLMNYASLTVTDIKNIQKNSRARA